MHLLLGECWRLHLTCRNPISVLQRGFMLERSPVGPFPEEKVRLSLKDCCMDVCALCLNEIFK